MHVKFRLPYLTGALLLAAATPFAAAESPMPEPIAPAVIGRPLDQIRPVRPVRPVGPKGAFALHGVFTPTRHAGSRQPRRRSRRSTSSI